MQLVILFGLACAALGGALVLCFTRRRTGSGGEGAIVMVTVGPEEMLPAEKGKQ